MRADGTKGHLDLVLLGALDTAPGHGYAVISAIRERSGGVLELPEGSVYPALHRLEDLGLVMSEWVPVSGRRRREYHLTAEGKRALGVERAEWSRMARAIEMVAIPPPCRPGNALSGGLA